MELHRVAVAFIALVIAFSVAFAAGKLAGDRSSARTDRAAPIRLRGAEVGAAVQAGGALPVLRLGAPSTEPDRAQAPIAPNPQPSQPPLLDTPQPAPAQPAPQPKSPPQKQPEPIVQGGGIE